MKLMIAGDYYDGADDGGMGKASIISSRIRKGTDPTKAPAVLENGPNFMKWDNFSITIAHGQLDPLASPSKCPGDYDSVNPILKRGPPEKWRAKSEQLATTRPQ